MGNARRTDMQLKSQDSRNPSAFVTTPQVGGLGLNLTAANHAMVTLKFCVLNEQRQAFAGIVRLGQNWVPHSWVLNTGPGHYDNCVSDLSQHSGVAQLRVLHSVISQPNIKMTMIYRILKSCEDHAKQLTEQGNKLHSDGPSSWIVRTIHPGSSLWTVTQHNLNR